MEAIIQAIYDDIIEGRRDAIEQDIETALEAQLEPNHILDLAMIAAMEEVGSRFERQEFYLPEMFVAAESMRVGLAVLRPLLVTGSMQTQSKVALGTVQGDLHDIGKNLVGMLLEGAGFDVVDLGMDTHPEYFVEAAREGADLIGISALLTTTMLNMGGVIEALSDAGLREQTKILVGGAPVTQAFADQIGADGYAPDASRAVAVAKSLLAEK